MEENRIADAVIGAAIEVHRQVGPGLLESTYQRCLEREFALRHLPFASEVPVPIAYKGLQIDLAYRMDFVVADKLVIEVKAVAVLEPVHKAQLLTYLKWSGHRLGLLLNFHAPLLKSGIVRIANHL